MPILIQIHVLAACIAILFGAAVFLSPKGTKRHRRLAWVYVTAMLVTTSVVIFVPATVLEFGNSGWGFFHLFIAVGGISSVIGIFALMRWKATGDPAWLRNHQVRFAFSYAGLLMAGASQFATNPRFGIIDTMNAQQFWIVFGLTNLAILAVAMVMVQRYIMQGDPRRRHAMQP